MEPRLLGRGDELPDLLRRRFDRASMEPRLLGRGDTPIGACRFMLRSMLQWSRAC